jgi:hypothetical protein
MRMPTTGRTLVTSKLKPLNSKLLSKLLSNMVSHGSNLSSKLLPSSSKMLLDSWTTTHGSKRGIRRRVTGNRALRLIRHTKHISLEPIILIFPAALWATTTLGIGILLAVMLLG